MADRINQHNNGRVKSTRLMRPLEVRAFIECHSMTESRQAEYRLKKYKSRIILNKVIEDLTFPWNHKGP